MSAPDINLPNPSAPENGMSRRRSEDFDPARVDNPFRNILPEDLDKAVEEFHREHRLARVVDLGMLQRGARLAQNADVFRARDDVTVVERVALEREEKPRLTEQSKDLIVVLLTCCIAAVVQ